MSGVTLSRGGESTCRSSSASSYSSDQDAMTSHGESNDASSDYTVKRHRYLNYPPINVLQHKDAAFLIVVDTMVLSLLGYKNDHVVRNNISPSSKFKPDNVLSKHSYSTDVWLLDIIGLKQLIAATNNPKINQFKQWLIREILDEAASSSTEFQHRSTQTNAKRRYDISSDVDATTSRDDGVRIIKPIAIPRDTNDKLYLIRTNDKFHLVSCVYDLSTIQMLYCWRYITPEMRSRFTTAHEDAINVIYQGSADFTKVLMYVEHILYRT